MLITVPRLDGALSVMLLAAGFQPPAVECSVRARYGAPDTGARVSGHVSHFTARALFQLARASGLEVEEWSQASLYQGWVHSRGGSPPRVAADPPLGPVLAALQAGRSGGEDAPVTHLIGVAFAGDPGLKMHRSTG